MDRRQFLAVTGSALLAGCPGDSASTTTTRGTDRSTPPSQSLTAESAGGTPRASTASQSPTESRTPSATPDPTTRPSPTPTTRSTPVSPEPVTLSGRGNATRRVDVVGGLTIIDGVYKGSGSFSVTLSSRETGEVRRFFDTAGPHSGGSAGLLDGGPYTVDVVAEKTYWSLTVRQPRPTSGSSLPVYLDETGSDVFGPYEFPDGASTAAASHTSEGPFLLEVWPLAGDFSTVVFDRTDRFAGETSFGPPDLGYVEVTAAGDWTLGLRGE